MPHNHNKCNSWMLQRQTNTKVVATYFILSAVRACLLNNLRSEAKGFKIATFTLRFMKFDDSLDCVDFTSSLWKGSKLSQPL